MNKTLKMSIPWLRGLLFGLLLIGSHACMENDTWNLDNVDETIDVNVELAAPLARGFISILETMEDYGIDTSEFKYDDDSLLYFDYWKEFNITDFIDVEIPDQDTVESITPDELPFTVLPLTAGLSFRAPQLNVDFNLKVTGGDIYSIFFNAGIFGVEGVTGFGGIEGIQEEYTVRIPELSKNGVSFEHTFDGDNFSGTKLFDLDDYKLNFVRGEDEKIEVLINYVVTNTSENLINLSITEPISFTMRLNSIEPRFITGYMETTELSERVEEVRIPVLSPDYVQDSTVFFYDPQIEIFLENWVGMPFDVTLKKLLVINTETRDSVDLEYNENVIPVDSATSVEVGLGRYDITPSNTDISINRENSKIHDVLNKVYNRAYISYCITANPDGPSDVDNFLKVAEDTQLKLTTHTILPLWVKVKDYIYNDTVDFDFQTEIIDDLESDTATLNSLDSLIIMLDVKNGLPVELKAQVYIVDENDVLLDSLFSDTEHLLLAAAPINNEGVSNGKSASSIQLVYTEERLESWKAGKKIIFNVTANSSNAEYVKVKMNQGIEYSLGFYTKANIDDELLDAAE